MCHKEYGLSYSTHMHSEAAKLASLDRICFRTMILRIEVSCNILYTYMSTILP